MHGREVAKEQGAPQQGTGRQNLGHLCTKNARHGVIEEDQMGIVRCTLPREEEQHHEHDDAHHRPGDAFHQLSAQAGVLGKPALEEDERNEHADRGELFAAVHGDLGEVQLIDQRKQACRDGRDDEGVGDV